MHIGQCVLPKCSHLKYNYSRLLREGYEWKLNVRYEQWSTERYLAPVFFMRIYIGTGYVIQPEFTLQIKKYLSL